MSRTWRKRDERERVQRDRWGGGGTLFPVIAADVSDVICHSKKHFGDQMFRLNAVEWVYILLCDQYRSSTWQYLSLLHTQKTLMSLQQ